jgi:hypothetical protein
MLTNCFFPNTNDVIDESNKSSKCDVTVDTDVSENDVGIEITEDDDVAQDYRDDLSLRDEAEKVASSIPSTSIIGDFSVFRDFFLAAFSDGYYKVRRTMTRQLPKAMVVSLTPLFLLYVSIC